MMQTPIRVITVEREYGSRGGEFAHDLAERLGWRLLDSELVSAAARRAGVTPELAAKFDDRLDPWYYRYGKVFWHDTAYQMTGLSEDQVFDSRADADADSRRDYGRGEGRQLRAGGSRRGMRAGVPAGMLSCFCLCHVEGEARLVCAGISEAGATCGAEHWPSTTSGARR